MLFPRTFKRASVTFLSGLIFAVPAVVLAQWKPAKTVEFVVPAGTGGGADQMARFIQGIVTKNNLMKPSMVVVNKGGGAGAEGFLQVKGAKGDPHKIIITLSNLFTTPLATGVPFNWRDLTPVAMLALDQFVLWVNADSPYRTTREFIESAKKAGAGKLKMAGTGARQGQHQGGTGRQAGRQGHGHVDTRGGLGCGDLAVSDPAAVGGGLGRGEVVGAR